MRSKLIEEMTEFTVRFKSWNINQEVTQKNHRTQAIQFKSSEIYHVTGMRFSFFSKYKMIINHL